MKIGISINNVLRDYFHRIEDVYDKYFPNDDEDYEGLHIKDYDLEKYLIFPEEEVEQGELEFNPEFNEDSFMKTEELTEVEKKKEKVTIEEFLYERCTLDVFGYADEIGSSVEVLNNLIIEYPDVEFVIISRELGLSIPSTHFFLSKTSSMCPNVKFVKEYKQHWDHVDIMVTDHPEILESKTEGKKTIKIEKPYNESVESDYSTGSMHTLPDVLKELIK